MASTLFANFHNGVYLYEKTCLQFILRSLDL